MFTEDTVLENSSSSQEAEDLQERTAKPLTLLNEMTPEVQQKVDLIDGILQAPDRKSRSEAIQKASEALGRTPRMIRLMVKRVESEGVATLGVGCKDKGQFRISEQWFKFIIATQSWGQRDGSRMNHNQVHAPYHRIHWQFRSTEECEKHQLPLISRCPACDLKFSLPAEWEEGNCKRCGMKFTSMKKRQLIAKEKRLERAGKARELGSRS